MSKVPNKPAVPVETIVPKQMVYAIIFAAFAAWAVCAVYTVRDDGKHNRRCSDCVTCVGCDGCTDCVDCVSCRDCKGCRHCTFCTGCINLYDGVSIDGCEVQPSDPGLQIMPVVPEKWYMMVVSILTKALAAP